MWYGDSDDDDDFLLSGAMTIKTQDTESTNKRRFKVNCWEPHENSRLVHGRWWEEED